jgi:sulfite exporter TauE/SafE
MLGTFITHLQIFGIGFSFGIIGPCFLSCTPFLAAYLGASKRTYKQSFLDIFIFLSARVLAYAVIGALAGASAMLLKSFISSYALFLLRPLAGLISILLAIFILINNKKAGSGCAIPHKKIYGLAGVFGLGFAIGITPCGPLLALASQITLISKNALEGALYALSFGLGTFLSGFLVATALAGMFTWLPLKLLKTPKSDFVFRVACAALLILFGGTFIVKAFLSYNV